MDVPQIGLHTDGLVDIEGLGKLQYGSPVVRLGPHGIAITRPSLEPWSIVREGPIVELTAISQSWLSWAAHPGKRSSITCAGDDVGRIQYPESDRDGVNANPLIRMSLVLDFGASHAALRLEAIIGEDRKGWGIPGCAGLTLRASCTAPTVRLREAVTRIWHGARPD